MDASDFTSASSLGIYTLYYIVHAAAAQLNTGPKIVHNRRRTR